MNKTNHSEKVLVAMSGGVDSSVTATLLKRAGFDVAGAFMKLWRPGDNFKQDKNEEKAKEIADSLDIPFYSFNFGEEFKAEVVDYFLKEYRQGRTPNPCVVCNNEIKFGLFLKQASDLNVDFIATGHYARLKRNNKVNIYRPKDKSKDQTYFLWQLDQNKLDKVLFPLGNFEREEVERMADSLNLPDRAQESHEVCFIPNEIKDFLNKHLDEKPGKIISEDGEELGEHEGAYLFTLGQRKGLGLSNGPWYVLEKNVKENKIVVTKERENLKKKELIADEINWISGKPDLPMKVITKIRYNSSGVKAELKEQDNKLKVTFNESQWAIAPGQSVVFYSGDQLLGGGVIQ
ncbi:MAG: tRNA 2-thiouridine(34) synthase MnmA [Candidatus Paceibacterota bacterium]